MASLSTTSNVGRGMIAADGFERRSLVIQFCKALSCRMSAFGPTVAGRVAVVNGPKASRSAFSEPDVVRTGSDCIAPLGTTTGAKHPTFRLHRNVCRAVVGCQRNGFQGDSSIAERAAETPPTL